MLMPGGDEHESQGIAVYRGRAGSRAVLTTQCQEAAQQLTDPELKNCVNQLLTKHRELFNRFYQLV